MAFLNLGPIFVNDFIDQALYHGPIPIEEFVDNIIFLLFRDCYLQKIERMRYGKYYEAIGSNLDFETSKVSFRRAINAMYKRKEEDAERLGLGLDYQKEISTPTKEGNLRAFHHVSIPDGKGISSYSTSLRDLDIVSLLKNGRILDTANIHKDKIANAYKDVFVHLEKSSKLENHQEWINALIDFSFLESSCAPVFLYAVAKYMNENHEKDISLFLVKNLFSQLVIPEEILPKMFAMLCPQVMLKFCPSVVEQLNNEPFGLRLTLFHKMAESWYSEVRHFPIQSRFLHNRVNCIDLFFGNEAQIQNSDLTFSCLLITHGFTFFSIHFDDRIMEIMEELCTTSIDDAYNYFYERYNLFVDFQGLGFEKPEIWTNQFVRIFRDVVKTLTYDGAQYAAKHASKSARQTASKKHRNVPRSK